MMSYGEINAFMLGITIGIFLTVWFIQVYKIYGEVRYGKKFKIN